MANQTITADANHDSLTGRAAGEDITIQQGAKLTIDSCPHLTAMGILGDILLTKGEVHIDGTRTKEIAYSGGTGTRPTAIPTTVTWDGGASSGKIIRYDSGDSTSGVITITVDEGDTLEDDDQITDGSWTADVDTVDVGLLVVFGEDQVWDATDATCTLRVTGDWYDLAVGDGTDNQVISMPANKNIDTGHVHALWVETGNGTGIFEIWHRVGIVASTVFFDAVADWGATYSSGKVFSCAPGSGTVTFGTSTAGGAPPNGARIRIPNVYMGTTTTGSPTTEVTGVTLASYLELIDGAVTENVFIDHLFASSVQLSLVQTNGGTITDSAIGLWNVTNIINRCNNPVTLTNCAFVAGSGLTGDTPANNFIIQDNLGGITITDCVFVGGTNANAIGTVMLTTMDGVVFNDCKFVTTIQDENSTMCIRGSVATNVVFNGDTICLNGGIATLAGCIGWYIEKLIWGQLTARGTTEDSITLVNLTGTDDFVIDAGEFSDGGAAVRHMTAAFLFLLTDSSNCKIRSFGSPSAKIDCDGRGTGVVSCAGITNNCKFQRLYFTNRNTALPFTLLNSCKNITFENCSCDYNDEIEMMANACLHKGTHGASGNIGTATGVEDDYPNVVDSIFYDVFKSDTTGGIGLTFNPLGADYGSFVTIDSGAPEWNGIGDMLMPDTGDQVTFTFPYLIRGHTGFQNVQVHTIGTNAGTLGTNNGNFDIEYAIDTGSGYGAFKAASGANLSGETIPPTGFGLKIRVKVNTANANNNLRGLQILTDTTLTAQTDNLYPLEVVTVSVTARDADTQAAIEDARALLYATTGSSVIISRSGSTATVSHVGHGYVTGQKVVIIGADQREYNGIKTITVTGVDAYTFTVSGTPDTPATGTILSHRLILNALTNGSGVAQDTAIELVGSSLAVTGRIRETSTPPLYKTSPISGVITSAGLEISAFMVAE